VTPQSRAGVVGSDTAVRPHDEDDRRRTIVTTLEHYVTVNTPEPAAWEWRDGHLIEIPVDQYDDDTDGFIVTAAEIEMPTIDDLASMILRDLDELAAVPARWRYWRSAHWLMRKLYALGVVSGYGMRSGGPHGHAWYLDSRPSWSFFRGPYALFLPRWWWTCQRTQGWRLRGRHRPLHPGVMGICAACLPCPDCGAPYECREGCPQW
jgi:hypothetical protein